MSSEALDNRQPVRRHLASPGRGHPLANCKKPDPATTGGGNAFFSSVPGKNMLPSPVNSSCDSLSNSPTDMYNIHTTQYLNSSPIPHRVEYRNKSPTPHRMEYRNTSPTPDRVEYRNTSPTPHRVEYRDTSPTPHRVEYRDNSPTPHRVEYRNTSPTRQRVGFQPVVITTSNSSTSISSASSDGGNNHQCDVGDNIYDFHNDIQDLPRPQAVHVVFKMPESVDSNDAADLSQKTTNIEGYTPENDGDSLTDSGEGSSDSYTSSSDTSNFLPSRESCDSLLTQQESPDNTYIHLNNNELIQKYLEIPQKEHSLDPKTTTSKYKQQVKDSLDVPEERLSRQRRNSDCVSHRMQNHSSRMPSPHREYHRSVSTCVELVKLHFSDVETRLFEMFGNKQSKTINVNKFLAGLMSTGLRKDDPRLSDLYDNVRKVKLKVNKVDDDSLVVNYNTFMGIISENLETVVRAFSHSFIIPEFRSFCDRIDVIYNKCKDNRQGKTAEYIPQLMRMNKDYWAVSICTVDGQRHSVGDVRLPFTIQSCSKPLTYAIACADNGPEKMDQYIGLEPSGRFFNELCLDYKNKPHNPMINSGAIMTAALVKPEYSAADRFDYMFEMYKRLAAGEYLGFNNSVFLSEKECADRNFALAYFMRENKCFPPGTKLHETLEFYFQLCSLEITAESGAVMAATLANGGINPLSGDPVLTCEAVRNTLTLMHSCGMYNYSGQFAFKVGLPAKSGVSGCVLLVVPNTLGICLWSPSLDLNGNSCRAVQFCSELVNLFKFHHFDNLRGNISSSTKIDPRVTKTESSAQILFDLLFCVAANDISSLRRHALAGTDFESSDYDGRTALHVAASEGHVELVEFLLEKCLVNPSPKDRWKRTPLDDARNFGHPKVERLLLKFSQERSVAGTPNITGTPNPVTGTPNLAGTPNLVTGTPNHVAGTPVLASQEKVLGQHEGKQQQPKNTDRETREKS